MKFLIPFLFLILIAGTITPVFAYPQLVGEWRDDNYNSAYFLELGIPEYYIIPENFDGVGEITVHVTFENPTSRYEGLMWGSTLLPYQDDVDKSLAKIYADNYRDRILGIEIKDVTDSTHTPLDRELFKTESDYNLIATTDHTYGYMSSLQLEVLDIEENTIIKGPLMPSLLEFEFTLSSSEFELGKTYEFELVSPRGTVSETFEFVDRTKAPTPQETSTPSPKPTPPKELSTEEQMKLQQQQAIQQAEQRKQQRELEKQKESNLQIANPASLHCTKEGGISEIINGQYGVCTLPDGTQCEEWEYFRGECGAIPVEDNMEPAYTPEPIPEQANCGKGTILKDGYCQVVKNEPAKEKGFLEWLMSLFGM